MTGLVDYNEHDGFACIAMDDGKLNVMSLAMLQALHEAFDRAATAGLPVVLRGREGVFSAGFDMKVFAAADLEGSHAMVRAGAELALKLLQFETPVLALCTGHAYPMGAFLLLAADVRIGVEGTYRMGLNEVAIGIAVPSFGLELARQRLTPAALARTALTGALFSPAEAVDAGLLDQVVSASGLDAAAAEARAAIAAIHLPSHAAVKQRLRGSAIAAVRAAIDAEITIEAYRASARRRTAVVLPKAS